MVRFSLHENNQSQSIHRHFDSYVMIMNIHTQFNTHLKHNTQQKHDVCHTSYRVVLLPPKAKKTRAREARHAPYYEIIRTVQLKQIAPIII